MASQVGDEVFRPQAQVSQIVTSKHGMNKLKYRGRAITMDEKQSFTRPRHIKRAEFQPVVTSVINFGVSPPISEFRIYEQSDFETCEWLTLRGTITRQGDGSSANGATGIANASLCDPSPLWIDRIEFLTGGSTSVIQTLYGDQLWYALTTIPAEKLTTFLQNNSMYMGTDFKVNNNIHRSILATTGTAVATHEWRHKQGNTTTRPFVIPILGSLLDKFRLRALCGDTIIRVYWQRQIASILSTLASPPTATGVTGITYGPSSFLPTDAASNAFFLSSLQMVLETEEVLERDKMAYEMMLKQSPLFVKFVEPIVQTFTQTVTANVQNQFQLTAIYGDIAFLQIYLKKATGEPQSALRAIAPETLSEAADLGTSAASLGGTGATVPLIYSDWQDGNFDASLSITDSSSKQLFSPNGFKAFDARYAHHSKALPNTFCNSVPMYLVPFCESPAAAINEGAIDGYVNFCGSEYLRIQPSSVFVSQAYKVTVVGWRIKHAAIEKKMLAVM